MSRQQPQQPIRRVAPGTLGRHWAQARAALATATADARETVRLASDSLPQAAPRDPGPSPHAAGPSWAEQQDIEALHGQLDGFKALVFNGAQSVKLAVSGRRLNRVSRQLHGAQERLAALACVLRHQADSLCQARPRLAASLYLQAALAYRLLGDWGDITPSNTDAQAAHPLAAHVLESFAAGRPLRLAFFICPPVDFKRLHSVRPEEYLLDSMHGSVLSSHVARLGALVEELELGGIPLKILALIGDTDEEDYFWKVTGRPAGLNPALLEQRREELVHIVADYLCAEPLKCGPARPRVVKCAALQVLRLSALVPSAAAREAYERIAANVGAYFSHHEIEAEIAIMKRLLEPGAYYDGLLPCNDSKLARMVAYKFAAYAMQGQMLHELDPHLVLIQTERPPLLRMKMLNTGRLNNGLHPLVAVHLFSIDENHEHLNLRHKHNIELEGCLGRV